MAVVVDRIAGGASVSIPVSLTTSMGATTTDGILLGATNSATAGAQVFSPALHFRGSGWKTTATAAAQAQNWVVEALPVEDTTRPSNQLVFSAYSDAEPTQTAYLVIRRPNATEGILGVCANNGNSIIRGAATYSNLVVSGIYAWDISPSQWRALRDTVFTFSNSTTSVSTPDTGISRISTNVVGIGNGTAQDASGTLKATSIFKVPLTVATLPAGATRGYCCLVTDASAPTFLAVVAGGASTITPVFYDGAAWKVG